MSEPEQDMEIAHVLCVEIYDFASLPINEQTTALQGLSSVVNSASAVQTAQSNRQLFSLVTPNGMSLAFFGSPEAPLRCAIAISIAGRQKSHPKVRMGIHSGPVFRVHDTQGKESVAGGGMTTALRVLECGDPGHILLSAAIAEVLAEHTRWKPFLTDLGVSEVKPGTSIRIYNFKNDEAGNAHVPRSIRAGLSSASWQVARAGAGVTPLPPQTPPPSSIPANDAAAAELTRGIAPLELGSALGEYELLGELGAGGIGKVYKARHRISQRLEALKVLQQDQLGTPEMVERFVREIRVLASLNHPNIAALHTAFRHEDRLVMVMEYVEGEALSDQLAASRVTIAQGVEYIRQVLRALVYAHERGIIHRDIKPSNIIILSDPSPTAKLLDFGLAVSGRDLSLTASGTIMGSLYYMSPEQVRGERVDARSDLYSLGVTFYEMVSGRRPFDGRSQYEILDGHLRQQPVPPTDLNPNVPVRLAGLILRALVKDAGARFQSAGEFLRALEAYLAETGGSPPGAVTTPLPSPGLPPSRPQNARAEKSVTWITPPVVKQVASQLAEYIGPIAHIVVERTAARCSNVDELYSALAMEIESSQDRAKFLASRSRKPT
ncbi:MAG TPA: protein kinase [Candidatus Acidoferrales bacterium]|nr:protein kinase [Candidatus Acidoferrales bacterium]